MSFRLALTWIWPTAAGWLLLLTVAIILFMAFNTGYNLLYLMAGYLLAMWLIDLALVALVSLPQAAQLEFEAVAPRGGEAHGWLRLSKVPGHARRLMGPLELKLRLVRDGAGPTVTILTTAQMRVAEPYRVAIVATGEQRGEYTRGSLRLGYCFPLGFFEATTTLPITTSLLVGPAIADNDRLADGFSPEWSPTGETATGAAGDAGDYQGVREAGVLTSMRSIHWRLSARKDHLVTIERRRMGGRRALVVVPFLTEPAAFELALDQAAGALTRLLREGVRTGIAGWLPEPVSSPLGEGPDWEQHLLRILALATAPSATGSAPELSALAAGQNEDAAWLVVGSSDGVAASATK